MQCGLCEKLALYRYGTEGRCRAHRDHIPQTEIVKRNQLDHCSAAIGRGLADYSRTEFVRYGSRLRKYPHVTS